MAGARWRVLSISKNEVALELVEGIHEETYNGKRHFPGFVARISSTEDFRNKFPGTKRKQLALETFKKVKLP